MKYCLSSKVSKEYLQKADEIKILYKDGKEEDFILDLLEFIPNLSIVLELPLNKKNISQKEWDRFEKYNILCKNQFKIIVYSLEDIMRCQKHNIKSMLYNCIYSFEELNYVVAAGASDIRISGELVHNLDLLDKFEITKRLYPNQSIIRYGINPIVGSWIRPEDIENITQIDICEFLETKREREQALYRIYAEEHAWSGHLNLLIEDIENDEIMNRMLPPQFQEHRSNCGWACVTKKRNCHYCENNLFLANPNLYKETNNERSNSEG